MGKTITYNYIYWAEVYLNLHKAQRRWGTIARVIEMTGATVQSQVAMYKAVAQLVLLYESESWVATGDMIKVLMDFYHQATRRI